MHEVRPQSILEQRVGLLAVALTIEPDFEPSAAGEALVEASAGNPTGLRRALGRVLAGPSGGSGAISRRAAQALRSALQHLAPEIPAPEIPLAVDGSGRRRG